MSKTSPGQHLVLYDGVCALCNGLVQFVLARDRRRGFRFASLQSAAAREVLARFGETPDDLNTFYVIADYQSATPRRLTKARALIFVLSALGWPWRAGAILRVVPNRLLNVGYDFVAKHRYRLFGRYEQCLAPTAEYGDRFIDAAP
jgi:predicted DCC family thiol-disulfide oxidoreductase YuxK